MGSRKRKWESNDVLTANVPLKEQIANLRNRSQEAGDAAEIDVFTEIEQELEQLEQQMPQVTCLYCYGTGHLQSECPQLGVAARAVKVQKELTPDEAQQQLASDVASFLGAKTEDTDLHADALRWVQQHLAQQAKQQQTLKPKQHPPKPQTQKRSLSTTKQAPKVVKTTHITQPPPKRVTTSPKPVTPPVRRLSFSSASTADGNTKFKFKFTTTRNSLGTPYDPSDAETANTPSHSATSDHSAVFENYSAMFGSGTSTTAYQLSQQTGLHTNSQLGVMMNNNTATASDSRGQSHTAWVPLVQPDVSRNQQQQQEPWRDCLQLAVAAQPPRDATQLSCVPSQFTVQAQFAAQPHWLQHAAVQRTPPPYTLQYGYQPQSNFTQTQHC